MYKFFTLNDKECYKTEQVPSINPLSKASLISSTELKTENIKAQRSQKNAKESKFRVQLET